MVIQLKLDFPSSLTRTGSDWPTDRPGFMKLVYMLRSCLWSKVRPPVQGRHTTLLRIHRWSPNLGGIYPSQRRTMNYINSDQLPDPHHIRTDGLVHRMRPKPRSFSILWLIRKLWLPLWSKSHNLRCEIYWGSHAPIDPIHRLELMNWMNSDERADLSRITSNRAKHRMRPLPQSLSTDYKVSVNESR